MAKSTSGGCACGTIRYEFTGDPIIALNCHCRDCQRASGSAYGSLLITWQETFRLTSGELKYFNKISDGANPIQRGFCPECGSPIGIFEPNRPKLMFLHAASLDDPSTHQPTMNIYTDSAHSWDTMDPSLDSFPAMPPIPDELGR